MSLRTPGSAPISTAPPANEREHVITVRGLVKRYGDVEAVRGIDLDVRRGEIFGFLGPNAAGKTTTISVLCTLAEASAGTAIVAGHDVATDADEVRARIGLVFQDPSLDDQLTARENLMFHARVYGVPRAARRQRIDSCLETVGLADRAQAPVKTFSGGMKRRLEVARGILHTPEVLFLDEPTQGLDPQTRARVWDHLREAHAHTTIFMTTHYLEEAEWCDRVAIIDHGRIVALGTPAELKAQVGGDVVVLSTDDNARATTELSERFAVEALQDNGTLRIEVPDGADFVPQVVRSLSVTVKTATVRRPSLDDVFLKLTGRAIRDESADARAQLRMFARRRGGHR